MNAQQQPTPTMRHTVQDREGLETWEELQLRHTHLELRKELKNVEVIAELEEWELDLEESWPDMRLRLEKALRSNALDHEKKPFSGLTVSVMDGKTTDGRPTSIVWQAAPSEEDGENAKQNSDHVLSALRLWGLELPNMALIVHGGSAHPWQLLRVQQMQDQRRDFLKSRPRFDNSYFDGERDPTQGWMVAGNAWRYPAFYVSPSFSPAEFTFSPSHTLFVDASLQVQEDPELIEHGDRTLNEWIMDAVTHQPIGRQPAIKGHDDIFYWDLNAVSTPMGNNVPSISANLRTSYAEWARSVEDEVDPMTGQKKVGQARYLMGTTKGQSIDRWASLTARLLLHDTQRARREEDSVLEDGEIRIELTDIKLNAKGQQKLTHLVQNNEGSGVTGGFSMSDPAAAMSALGAMTASAMSGDVLALVKVQLPGDPLLVSDPVRLGRGPIGKITKVSVAKRSYHSTQGDRAEDFERAQWLSKALASKSPLDSLMKISVVLADSTGKEVDDAEIGAFECSFKELLQDVQPDAHGIYQIVGEIDVFGIPAPKEKKPGSKRPALATASVGRPSLGPSGSCSQLTRSRTSFGLPVLARSKTSADLSASSGLSNSGRSLVLDKLEKPVSMGRLMGRIAIKPPLMVAAHVHESNAQQQLTEKARNATSMLRKSSKILPMPVQRSSADVAWSKTLADSGALEMASSSFGGRGTQGSQPDAAATLLPGEVRAPALVPMGAVSDYALPPTAPALAPLGLDMGFGRALRAGPTAPDSSPTPTTPPSAKDDLSSPPRVLETDSSVRAPASLEPLPSHQASYEEGDDQWTPRLVDSQLQSGRTPSYCVDDLPSSFPTPMRAENIPSSPPQPFGETAQGEPASPQTEAQTRAQTPPPSPPASPPHRSPGGGAAAGTNFTLLASSIRKSSNQGSSLVYTVAYWVMWRTTETIGDQRLLFGDSQNQPVLVRNNKLGVLVNNVFHATDYDPRWAGDNWQLVVACCDGAFSKIYIGHSSNDESGVPEAARAEEVTPTRTVSDVKSMMDGSRTVIRKLDTSGKGAGWLAQAWIWPRDLTANEVKELWMHTKTRYPVAKRGFFAKGSSLMQLSQYRPPPNPFADDKEASGGQAVDRDFKDTANQAGAQKARQRLPPMSKQPKPENSQMKMSSHVAAKVIEKDTAAMLEVPLVNKLAFQRLLNVFTVLVDYAIYSSSFIVTDRIHNFSPTAELMLELALRKNPTTTPTVLAIDSKSRLVKANHKLKELKRAKFLRLSPGITSVDYLNTTLRSFVTPQGITWLRASAAELASMTMELAQRPEARRLDAQHVRDVYELYGDEFELKRDGRPNQDYIWKNFYASQLFASATHYIIFDHVELKGRSLLSNLGTIGTVFMSGSSFEHKVIIDTIQSGAPLLLLESTGGVTQAFAHAMKAVRMMKPKWTTDYVLRLVTEYKVRAASNAANPIATADKTKQANKKYVLDNIRYLDRELARIDLLLSGEETAESWMRAFGLPEILMLFELWQRASDFLLRQVSMADVMKKSAEELLDVFTASFSSNAGGVPELGLGNAEIKVVATAWNRHLLLFHNGDKYNARSWIMQLVLYLFAVATTALSVFTTTMDSLKGHKSVGAVMLILPIVSALLSTIGTRLRQRQKYAGCKMASYQIVSEIYKFRVRSMEYDPSALAAAVAAKENAGKEKKKDEEEQPKPISGKERDKIGRQMFVERVKEIYTITMQTELSTGAAISHTSKYGLDPARLLRDGDEDDERLTKRLLQKHVAEKLYYIKSKEWEKGAEGYKELMEKAKRRRRAETIASVQSGARKVGFSLAALVISVAVAVEQKILDAKAKYAHNQAVKRGEATDDVKDKFRIKYASSNMGSSSQAEQEGDETDQRLGRRAPTKLMMVKEFLLNSGKAPTNLEDPDEARPEMLDETYRVPDQDEETPADDMEAGASGGRPGDDLLGPLSIDDYMTYRARPACTYLERTAPWRAFELQLLEIIVFVFNSLGAVLVGLGESWVPYVSLTVAIAAVCKSFTEFSRLEKQVEAYNAALREVHSMMNEWDGKTRTERRTRQTIAAVVGTVEAAMEGVAIALTDGTPVKSAKEGEAEEDDKKEE